MFFLVPDKPLQKDSGEKRKFEEIRIEIDSGATSMPNDKFQEKRFAEGGLEIQSEQTSATLNNAKGLIIGEVSKTLICVNGIGC